MGGEGGGSGHPATTTVCMTSWQVDLGRLVVEVGGGEDE